MSNKPFHYQAPFPLKKDDTEYYLLTSEHVSVSEFEGQEILKVAPEALTLLARQAFHDASFMLRPAHQQQVADILRDPKPAKMINMWRCNSCATPTSRRKAFCQPVRIPAPRLLLVKKGSVYGPVAVMKRRWHAVSITLISKIICATRKRAAGYV